ncbi:Tn3 family transposase [Streptosporangium album]|uniref:Tn3 family transposase n=1 Tax=Streptosporangium album TaxID=47479 RepID=UPI003CD07805
MRAETQADLAQLGDAIAIYGWIFKTRHILTYAVEEPYRRDIKGIRNLQEFRHALARLRAEGYRLASDDVARLSPFQRQRINVIGTYTFALPDLGLAGMRDLRNPDEPDWDEK